MVNVVTLTCLQELCVLIVRALVYLFVCILIRFKIRI